MAGRIKLYTTGGIVLNWSKEGYGSIGGHDIHSDHGPIENQIEFCECFAYPNIVAIWRPSKKNKVTDKK